MMPPDRLVEPRMGQVLGVRWGCTADEIRAAHPDVVSERTDPDVQTLSLAQFAIDGDLSARCVFTFCFDELVSVDLTLAGAGPEEMNSAARPFLSCFAGDPRATDVGLSTCEEGCTRIEIDRLDTRIRLEEIPT